MSRRQEYAAVASYQHDDDTRLDTPYDTDDDDDDEALVVLERNLSPLQRSEARMAERLSVRLLAIPDDDEEEHERVLRKSLQIALNSPLAEGTTTISSSSSRRSLFVPDDTTRSVRSPFQQQQAMTIHPVVKRRVWTMILIAAAVVSAVAVTVYVGLVQVAGPPRQPVGPYQLVEAHEGTEFLNYYSFYQGHDSVGSNGYNTYVDQATATMAGILNVTMAVDEMDVYKLHGRKDVVIEEEPFVFMGSSATINGPRDSIRLEGVRRFDRGLFMYV
jgi:hypothetical protein